MSSSTLRMQAGPITDLGQSSAKTISHARHAQLYVDIIERPNQGRNLEKILYTRISKLNRYRVFFFKIIIINHKRYVGNIT